MLAGLKIQKEELAELSASFSIIDKNQDGSLSYEELKEGLSGLCLFEML
jgi:Ca2+-binding EF-hand superfamily protein